MIKIKVIKLNDGRYQWEMRDEYKRISRSLRKAQDAHACNGQADKAAKILQIHGCRNVEVEYAPYCFKSDKTNINRSKEKPKKVETKIIKVETIKIKQEKAEIKTKKNEFGFIVVKG